MGREAGVYRKICADTLQRAALFVYARHFGEGHGQANNTTLNVYELLLAVNKRAVNGVLYNGSAALQQEAGDLFDALNGAGSVG